MVNVVETVIQQAAELGITLSVTGDKLPFRPASAAPQGFVDALRGHNPRS